MKNILTLLTLLFVQQQLASQAIKGYLKYHKKQQIKLMGFNYYDNYELGKATIDSLGNFTITYPKNYMGMAILKTAKNSTILILNRKDIELRGTYLTSYDSLIYKNSPQNYKFLQVAKGNAFNDRAYVGLRYLKKVYSDPYFEAQNKTLEKLNKEIERLESSNILETYNVSKESYLHWYAPLRKLISDMPQTFRNYPERIPDNINQFRKIDFAHPNFKTSGLFRELLEGHYFLLENMGQSLDSIYKQMNMSTEYLINSIKHNDSLLNKVSKELFNLFEKRSLFKASSHLSSKLLNSADCACELDEILKRKLEKYGALKVGNIAPDIELTTTKKLSDIKQNVLLVFGSSTCKACKEEAVQLLQFYIKWKEKGTPLEVIYISLDTDKEIFNATYKNAPWQSYCDYEGWETQAAKRYYVNATPTYLLLNKDRKILLHPKSVAHVNAWIQGKI